MRNFTKKKKKKKIPISITKKKFIKKYKKITSERNTIEVLSDLMEPYKYTTI